MTPDAVPALAKAGLSVVVEPGAGLAAGFDDDAYRERGASVAASRQAVFAEATIIVQVQAPSASGAAGAPDLALLRPEHLVIGHCDPLGAADAVAALARTGATAFAMELVPRITRAQVMDALSSQASIAGYKAVLLAATRLAKMMPLMMTAAGTIRAAKALVLGAGVAGLQAIASLRRLGAVIEAYDVRPAVREQVESLGAKFLELDLKSDDAEDKGGYARAMDDSFYRAQRELMAGAVANADVVITTAAVPGGRSPILVTEAAVRSMRRGSVIVDLAAGRGGNCECTRPDEEVDVNGVLVLGPTNLPATVPADSSLVYARNVMAFLKLLVTKEGGLGFDRNDEIIVASLLAEKGEVVNARVREMLGLETPAPLPTPEKAR